MKVYNNEIKLVEFNGYDDDGIDTGELLDWLTSVGYRPNNVNKQ